MVRALGKGTIPAPTKDEREKDNEHAVQRTSRPTLPVTMWVAPHPLLVGQGEFQITFKVSDAEPEAPQRGAEDSVSEGP